jgi:hypothetical protein
MLSKAIEIFRKNRKLIILIFEIFWIIVFLLDRYTGTNTSEIPQFVYVNF